MLSNKYFKSVLLAAIVILSVIAGLTLYFNTSPKEEGWQSFIPELNSSSKTITTLIVFNDSNYDTGLQLTLRSLQAIINSQLPDGKALFIIHKRQDAIILDQLYAKQNKFTIYQFPSDNSSLANLANLINYFKGVVKGYVYFNINEKIYYPGVINFLSNYQNTIAIPYPLINILPRNFSFLQMDNFLYLGNNSGIKEIADFYQNQINSFKDALSGVNIWNGLTDQINYFDYIINQKYFSFPHDLLNGSFPIVQQSIENLLSSHTHKPIINSWNAKIPRPPVPVYQNISDVNNLSLLSRIFTLNDSFESSFQTLFARNNSQVESPKNTSTKLYNYSLILNSEKNTINFIYNYVIPVLAVNSTFFDNLTIIIDDATIALLPDLFYWLVTTYSAIHLMPKILLSQPVEPIYFPQLFTNQTALVIQKSSTLQENEWNDSSYVNTLSDHFIGLYADSIEKDNTLFNLPLKKIYSTFNSTNDTSESQFLSYLQAVSQKNFVVMLTGEPNFLSSALFNFKLALHETAISLNSLFICYSASQLFNKVS